MGWGNPIHNERLRAQPTPQDSTIHAGDQKVCATTELEPYIEVQEVFCCVPSAHEIAMVRHRKGGGHPGPDSHAKKCIKSGHTFRGITTLALPGRQWRFLQINTNTSKRQCLIATFRFLGNGRRQDPPPQA